jgi:outer membrane protein OmpU
MKHTLLATTALVAMTGAAAAEITVSGTGRIGVRSTEGVAGSGGVTTYAKANTNMIADYTAANGASAHSALANGTAATADMIQEIDADIAASEALAAADTTAAAKAIQDANTATLKAVRAALVSTTAAVAKTADTTTAVNRFRISFSGSGETDSGISYGISGRADQSNTLTGGSQYVSGVFGKIKMGDLGGADKDAAGHIAGGVGLSGMGSNNEIAYQAADHNLGYEFSSNGLTFGYSQDTAIQDGSNSAVGLKWSGDMGGTDLTVGIGQSKMGTSTQSTMSVAVSMGGLTIKALSSSNDNGPATKASDEVRHASTAGAEKAYALAVAAAATPDTDHTGVSISYSVDALSVTAYSKTVSTTGSADKDYTGLGFAYDMGGATLKAGMVEDNKVSSMDIGISFSF